MPADPNQNGQRETMISWLFNLVRVLKHLAFGDGRKTLGDMHAIDPDLTGRGIVVGLHASVGASNVGLDVDFQTNPEYDVAIHSVRARVEVGTAENTVNGGGSSFNASHCAVKVQDSDRQVNILDGSGACAGGKGFVDVGLLGANDGQAAELRVPYIVKGVRGSTTLRATFATDSSWPGTRRVGIILITSYRRRSARQAEVVKAG